MYAVGRELIITQNTGKLTGRIRLFPPDFIVEEIWDNHIYSIKYSRLTRLRGKFVKFQKQREYLHFTLVKKNWETIRALNYIRKRLRVSLKRFGIAGMKDKKAITAQRVSLWKGRAENLARLNLSDIYLKDFEYADERINLGDALGNRFTITIRDIPQNQKEILKRVRFFRKMAVTRGVPNYYGPQRFGGDNTEVGAAIKGGDLKRAVEIVLKKVQPWIEIGDLEAIPRVFWYEKRIVHHLQQYPNDYAGALRKIPKRIRRIYIHAYQSHIFNQKLKQAITTNHVPSTFTIQGFQIPKMPELKAKTIERQTFIIPTDFHILEVQKDIVKLRFNLRRGEYATTFLSYLLHQEENVTA